MINQIKWVAVVFGVIVLAVFLSYFIQSNASEVQLKLLIPFVGLAQQTLPISLAWVVLLSFISGLVVSSAIMLVQLVRSWFQIRRLKRENSALQKLMERQESLVEETSKNYSSSSNP